jgi:hypothetical protein
MSLQLQILQFARLLPLLTQQLLLSSFITSAKLSLMVFDCVKPLRRELRGILFPIHKDKLFTGTPKDPEILYGHYWTKDALHTIQENSRHIEYLVIRDMV